MGERRGMLSPLPMEGRATILPFRDSLPGSVMNEREWAVPGMLAGAYNAFIAPERVRRGMLDPSSEEAMMEALNVAGYPMLAGAPAMAGARAMPGMLGVNVFHGSSRRGVKLKDLDPRHAVETPGAVFFSDNPDVADIFRYPREYGEVLFDQPRGSLVKADVNFKKPLELRGAEAQRFSDDSTYQGEVVRAAKAQGHDGIIVHEVKEGVGDVTERGTTYVAFDRSTYTAPPRKKAKTPQ
jgi:hypothetical protein